MGTRNLTMVMAGGKYEIAQYGQWDGNPGGNGLTILDFARARLSAQIGRDSFVDCIARARFLDIEEVKALWASVGADGSGSVSLDIADKFDAKWPSLSRNTGADILNIVWHANGEVPLRDQADFAADSLMCEWAYVIDLDKNTLEVFKGFNKSPLAEGERFASLPQHKPEHRSSDYFPVRHVVSYSLDALPSASVFVAEAEKDDEEGCESAPVSP